MNSKTNKSVGRGDRAAKTTEKGANTEDRDEPASNNDGRQESTVKGVCFMSRSAVLSVLGHLTKQAASTAHQTNNKTDKKQPKKQGRPDQTPGKNTKKHNKRHGRGAANNRPKHTRTTKKTEGGQPAKQDKGEGSRRRRQQRREGTREGSEDKREEAARAKERGTCSSSGVLKENLDHTIGEYLSTGRRSTENSTCKVEGTSKVWRFIALFGVPPTQHVQHCAERKRKHPAAAHTSATKRKRDASIEFLGATHRKSYHQGQRSCPSIHRQKHRLPPLLTSKNRTSPRPEAATSRWNCKLELTELFFASSITVIFPLVPWKRTNRGLRDLSSVSNKTEVSCSEYGPFKKPLATSSAVVSRRAASSSGLKFLDWHIKDLRLQAADCRNSSSVMDAGTSSTISLQANQENSLLNRETTSISQKSS